MHVIDNVEVVALVVVRIVVPVCMVKVSHLIGDSVAKNQDVVCFYRIPVQGKDVLKVYEHEVVVIYVMTPNCILQVLAGKVFSEDGSMAGQHNLFYRVI